MYSLGGPFAAYGLHISYIGSLLVLLIFLTDLGLNALVQSGRISFVTLMPAWAVNVLHGDARTNGFLQSARGVGALSAALSGRRETGARKEAAPPPEPAVQDQGNQPEKEVSDHDG